MWLIALIQSHIDCSILNLFFKNYKSYKSTGFWGFGEAYVTETRHVYNIKKKKKLLLHRWHAHLETAAWVQHYDIRSLIVVTAFYHMPRALTELRRVLPGVALYPDPVLTPHSGGIGRVVTLRLIVEEYTKYLLAVAGVTELVPEHVTLVSREAHPG